MAAIVVEATVLSVKNARTSRLRVRGAVARVIKVYINKRKNELSKKKSPVAWCLPYLHLRVTGVVVRGIN